MADHREGSFSIDTHEQCNAIMNESEREVGLSDGEQNIVMRKS